MKPSATSSVRNQLRFAFAVVVARSFLATAIAVRRLQVLSDDTQALTQRPLVKKRLMAGWLLNTSVAAKRTGSIARSADPEPTVGRGRLPQMGFSGNIVPILHLYA